MQSATLFLLYVTMRCSYLKPAIQYVFVSVTMIIKATRNFSKKYNTDPAT